MKQIPLTRGLFALVDDEDYEDLATYKWYAWISKNKKAFYAARKTPKGRGTSQGVVRMHQQILGAVCGQRVDHRDCDGLNNQRSNLRFATRSQNGANRVLQTVNNKSGYRGVCWVVRYGRWHAQVEHFGKGISLGYFDDPIKAAMAYDEAVILIWGEFARPNFPEVAS